MSEHHTKFIHGGKSAGIGAISTRLGPPTTKSFGSGATHGKLAGMKPNINAKKLDAINDKLLNNNAEFFRKHIIDIFRVAYNGKTKILDLREEVLKKSVPPSDFHYVKGLFAAKQRQTDFFNAITNLGTPVCYYHFSFYKQHITVLLHSISISFYIFFFIIIFFHLLLFFHCFILFIIYYHSFDNLF